MGKKKLSFSDRFAMLATKAFGSMPMFYLFAIYGLLPLIKIFSPYQDRFLYWSNWVQLWSLPLLMVGQNLAGRTAESRSKETHRLVKQSHDMIMEEIKSIQQTQKEEAGERREMVKIYKELKSKD